MSSYHNVGENKLFKSFLFIVLFRYIVINSFVIYFMQKNICLQKDKQMKDKTKEGFQKRPTHTFWTYF
jgi:hypothetical protein